MPVEVEINVTCDECGDAIEPGGRWSRDAVYCGNCHDKIRDRVTDTESELKDVNDQLQEREDYITELEDRVNDLLAEVDRLQRTIELESIES